MSSKFLLCLDEQPNVKIDANMPKIVNLIAPPNNFRRAWSRVGPKGGLKEVDGRIAGSIS